MVFLTRLKARCIWSWSGVLATWRSEYSFRSWVWVNLGSALLAFALPLTAAERALILALGLLVLAAGMSMLRWPVIYLGRWLRNRLT